MIIYYQEQKSINAELHEKVSQQQQLLLDQQLVIDSQIGKKENSRDIMDSQLTIIDDLRKELALQLSVIEQVSVQHDQKVISESLLV